MIRRLTLKNLLYISIGLLILSLILIVIIWRVDTFGAYHLDGSYSEAGDPEIIRASIMSLIITFPVICLIIGAIVAIFFQRELPYKKRFIKGFLFTLSIVYGIFSIAGIVKLFLLI